MSEFLFDRVYAFAITQPASVLIDRLTVRSTLETRLLLAVWRAWMYTSWATN